MVKILVQLSIITMMIDVGLQLTLGQVRDSAKRWKPLLMGLLLNVVGIPVVAYLVLSSTAEALGISAGVFAALALTGASPGAPIGPKMVDVAKGDLAYASILMLVCQLVSILSAPLTAQAILPSSGSEGTSVAGVILTLIGVLLVPMGIGMALRHKIGERASSLAKIAQACTGALFAGILGVLLVTQIEIFTSIRLVEYAYLLGVTLLFGLVALASPGLGSAERRSLVFMSGERNFALALVLASQGFGGEGAMGATLVLGALATTSYFLVAAVVGKRFSFGGTST